VAPSRAAKSIRGRHARGHVVHRDDGRYQEGTGCGVDDRERAVQLLAEYIAQRRLEKPRGARDPAAIPIADVIARYVRDVAAAQARPPDCRSRKVTDCPTIARHDAAGRQRNHSKPVVTAYELPPSEKLVMAHPTR
jgi:hypothetical protein